jgi:hypothetical protein
MRTQHARAAEDLVQNRIFEKKKEKEILRVHFTTLLPSKVLFVVLWCMFLNDHATKEKTKKKENPPSCFTFLALIWPLLGPQLQSMP